MRLFAMILVLLGFVGIGFGVLILIHGPNGLDGQSFRFENYGGPGPILAGLILVFAGLYLSSLKVRRG
jgi:hypothetical protein